MGTDNYVFVRPAVLYVKNSDRLASGMQKPQSACLLPHHAHLPIFIPDDYT